MPTMTVISVVMDRVSSFIRLSAPHGGNSEPYNETPKEEFRYDSFIWNVNNRGHIV